MNARILVIGGGQAGAQIALSLRESGHDGSIVVAGAEPHPPYQRPPLSKAYLKGATTAANLALRAPSVYERAGIQLVSSERVIDVRYSDAVGGSATTDSGTQLGFDRLALATGARPRRLTVEGADLAGICYLRNLADAEQLRARLDDAEHVVVIGGGFIGLEAAAVARQLGKQVSLVEAADRLIARAVAQPVSEFYQRAHERRGVRFHLAETVAAFEGWDGQVDSVQLGSGKSVRADLVVVGIGVEPRTELAEQLGLACDRGIVVDACARTSRPGIVAAGDCTVGPCPGDSASLMRLESVQNAVEQAKCAAAALAGRPTRYSAIPWFWSDQDTLKLQIAGLSTGFDQIVQRGDTESESFSVLYYRADTLIAVDAVNRPQDFMAVRRALTQGKAIPADLAADSTRSLKDLCVS